jgi:hypothetical protein
VSDYRYNERTSVKGEPSLSVRVARMKTKCPSKRTQWEDTSDKDEREWPPRFGIQIQTKNKRI